MGAHVLLLLPPSPGDKLCCGEGEDHVVLLPVPGSELGGVVGGDLAICSKLLIFIQFLSDFGDPLKFC